MIPVPLLPEQVQTEMPLFDVVDATEYILNPSTTPLPPVSQAMVLDGPGPMVGKDHPIESHIAADVAARSAVKSRVALLRLLAQEAGEDGIDAAEFQRLYHLRAERNGWPELGDDSPRKRLEDLANKYQLAERFIRAGYVGANGLPKGLYRLTDAGWALLRKAASA